MAQPQINKHKIKELLEYIQAFKTEKDLERAKESKNYSTLEFRMREQKTFLDFFWEVLLGFHLPTAQLKKLGLEPNSSESMTIDSSFVFSILLVLLDYNLNESRQTEELMVLHIEICNFQQNSTEFQERRQQLIDQDCKDKMLVNELQQLVQLEVLQT